jgi:hypothetical protein
MTKPQTLLRQCAAMESFRNQQQYLEQTIGRLVKLMKTLPQGRARDTLLNEISALDVIAGGIRRALDTIYSEDD